MFDIVLETNFYFFFVLSVAIIRNNYMHSFIFPFLKNGMLTSQGRGTSHDRLIVDGGLVRIHRRWWIGARARILGGGERGSSGPSCH
jgi:hypothetical protein